MSSYLSFWLFGSSTREPYTIILCASTSWVSLVSSLVSVHTFPCHRIRHRNFIFDILMYMCPPYMHIRYLVILICNCQMAVILVIAVCIYHYVMIMWLWSKYDMVTISYSWHKSLGKYDITMLLCYILQLYFTCNHLRPVPTERLRLR